MTFFLRMQTVKEKDVKVLCDQKLLKVWSKLGQDSIGNLEQNSQFGLSVEEVFICSDFHGGPSSGIDAPSLIHGHNLGWNILGHIFTFRKLFCATIFLYLLHIRIGRWEVLSNWSQSPFLTGDRCYIHQLYVA